MSFLKKVLISGLVVLVQFKAFSQEKGGVKVGLQGSLGTPHYIPSYADGAPSYDGKRFFDLGILFIKPVSEKVEFETGLLFSSSRFEVTPSTLFNDPIYFESMNAWIIPANFRFFVGKGFFLQAGPNLSQGSRDSFGTFRLGFSIGLGKSFDFGNGYSLRVSPTINANPFFPTNWDGVTQLGIRSIFAIPIK
jgi:hypothetical protein